MKTTKQTKKWIRSLDEQAFESLARDASSLLEPPAITTDEAVYRTIKETEPATSSLTRMFARMRSFMDTWNAGRKVVIVFGSALALAAAVILPLYLSNNSGGNDPRPMIVFLSGRIDAGTDGKNRTYHVGDRIEAGLTITGFEGTRCELYFPTAGTMHIRGASSISIQRFTSHAVFLAAHKGSILFRSDPQSSNKAFSIAIGADTIIIKGTSFVEWRNNEPYIGVNEGSARTLDGKIEIAEGTEVSLTQNTEPVPLSGSADIGVPDAPVRADFAGNGSLTGFVEISTGLQECSLFIDEHFVSSFDTSIAFALKQGRHSLRIEKKWYTPYETVVNIRKQDRIALDARLECALRGKSDWKWRTVYRSTNSDDPGDDSIIGFGASDTWIAAATRTSIIIIDANGTLVREHRFGRRRGLIFESIPLVHEGRVFASSNYALVVIDIETGRETLVTAPGIVPDGLRLALHKGRIFLPYPDGVYSFDPRTFTMSPSPVFKLQNPVTPVFAGDSAYVVSFLVPEINRYDEAGNFLGRHSLDKACTARPVIIRESGGTHDRATDRLLVADTGGTLRLFNPDLLGSRSLLLPCGASSLVADELENAYALCSNGRLSTFNTIGLALTRSIFIDSNLDPGIYFYKTTALFGEEVIIGKETGSIVVIHGPSGTIDAEFKVSDSPIRTAIVPIARSFTCGTKSGEIIFLE